MTDVVEVYLNSKVKDIITGIEGPVISIQINSFSTNEVGVARAGLDADGHPYPLYWFPVTRVKVLSHD